MIAKTEPQFEWQIDRFDDIKILRYVVSGFESLDLQQKILIYHLSEAALSGRDILFDQHFEHNLLIRKVLEQIYTNYNGDRSLADFCGLETYLKRVWFSSGIHHHYSCDKFVPNFSREFFEDQLKNCTIMEQATISSKELCDIIFCPELHKSRCSQEEGIDMIAASSSNIYKGVSQAQAEAFYAQKLQEGNTECPVSHGLNSRLEIGEDGKLCEAVWRVGGEYSAAIEKIVYHLKQASSVASDVQKSYIDKLIEFYQTGDLALFDAYSIKWTKDNHSPVDFVNGFIEVYSDPLGYKGSWEALVNFRNEEATLRTQKMSQWAQWFEDNSPIDPQYKKSEVKGVSAKVITVAMLGGDCYPATPIGINLPNADWIRKEHGSKSVTIENITDAYSKAAASDGRYAQEFYPSQEIADLIKTHGSLAGNLHTDLHECLGHGSGQLAAGVSTDALKNYGSPLEEARADLFALYYMGDQKLIDIGIMPSMEVMQAEYYSYLFNGLMGQLTRIELGKDVVQAHMRCRQLIAKWTLERAQCDGSLELVEKEGKSYVIVNDYQKIREYFAELLKEIQRIKSQGDLAAAKKLIEGYGVKVDIQLHKQVLQRYKALDQAPYSGFVNPVMSTVVEHGKIVDVTLSYTEGYSQQMLRYSSDYSFL